MFFCGFMSGSTRRLNQAQPGVVLVFKVSQKVEPRLKVSSNRLVKTGLELGTPGYKASDLSTTPGRLSHVGEFEFTTLPTLS